MQMMEIIESLLLKNRTIVTHDMEQCLSLLAGEIDLEIHRYSSGAEYGTWVIPPQWDVAHASLSDGDQIIASFDDHPLFLAPYSISFTGWVVREELLRHVRCSEQQPDSYSYEHRLAYDFGRRLNDWVITLPYSIVKQMDRDRYLVDIKVETRPGHMLVGEHTTKGLQDYTFAFLTHLCHTGQANDGLAGVAVGVEVIKRIKADFETTNFNYQLLIFPETVGSAAYLASNPAIIDSYLGSIFIEMPGIRSPLRLKFTRRGNTYLDRVLHYVITNREAEFSQGTFREPWGNDELIFDSPGVGIPGAAIQRYPFNAYHTSNDDMEETDKENLEEIVEILIETVRIIESDFIPVPRQRVPVYLTRFNLYADAQTNRPQHDMNGKILDSLWSGKSAFDIAQECEVPYVMVKELLAKLVEFDLVEKLPLDPRYFRQSVEPHA